MLSNLTKTWLFIWHEVTPNLDLFNKSFSCHPPLLVKDTRQMCNRKFNVSDSKNQEIHELFKNLYFKCRTPCTRNVYTSKYIHAIPYHESLLVLSFDRTLDVVHSSFSIDGQTLLTILGGSVSSGRTLLGILVSLLGAAQVTFCWSFIFPGVQRNQDDLGFVQKQPKQR